MVCERYINLLISLLYLHCQLEFASINKISHPSTREFVGLYVLISFSLNKFNANFVEREKYLILILRSQFKESTSNDQDPLFQYFWSITLLMYCFFLIISHNYHVINIYNKNYNISFLFLHKQRHDVCYKDIQR